MTYNLDDNKVLHEASINAEPGKTGPAFIIVEVVQYKDSEPKIQLTRSYTTTDGESRRAKLGRIRACEVTDIVATLKEAEEFIVNSGGAPIDDDDAVPF